MLRRARNIVLLAFVALSSMGAAGDHVRVILETPAATPFSVVRYEVVARGRATSVIHRRQLPSFGEPLHGLALLTRAEAEGFFELIGGLDATALGDAVAAEPRPDQLTWQVELSIGGREHAFRVTEPREQPDRRYHRLVSAVQRLVAARAGELPFRNVFFPPGDLGWVNILTIPVAKVTIDGFDIRQETPLYSYEVSAGKHAIRLRSLDDTYDRTYRIKVEPGVTTHLAVDLR